MPQFKKFPLKLNFFFLFLSFLTIVGFEFRALHMLGRHSTTWAMPPVLFALVILWMGSHIYA
jgi:ABC-type uncharacterized transport system permease subunit